MPTFLTSAYFVWFIIGFGLALLELAAPGFILIFFGLGAWTTAVFAAILTLSLSWQVVIFMVSSVVYILVLRRVWMRAFKGASGEDGTDEGLSMSNDVGKTVKVTRQIQPGIPGEIKYRGSFWRAIATERIEQGQAAVIVGQPDDDRNAFIVESFNKGD